MTDAADPNQHIKEYLRYFLSLPGSPGFAVLIKGPWGVGKTHLIRRFLDELSDRKTRVAYVTLFGLKNASEIDDALFASMYGELVVGDTTMPERLVGAAAKWARLPIDDKADVRSLLVGSNAEVFVFDDLERSALSAREVLGYINQFVEHTRCKVIIIADDAKLARDPEYISWTEKIVGQSLELRSSFGAAFDAFVADVPDEGLRGLLASEKARIADVYQRSEINNLRVLRQTIGTFERFYAAVDERHRADPQAMASLLRFLFALSFELRANRLAAHELVGRQAAHAAYRASGSTEPAPWIALAVDRYPGVDLTETAIPDEMLADILIKGFMDAEALRAALDVSSYFVTIAEEPAWRTLWHSFTRTTPDFVSALERIEEQFRRRAFVEPGEIMQVVGLRLWLARVGELPLSSNQVADEAMAYIDDLHGAGSLTPLVPGADEPGFDSGHQGLGFYERHSPEFREVADHLSERRRQVEVEQRPAKARDLLATLNADPEAFFRRLVLRDDPASLATIPVLATIEPREFIVRLLALHPAQQRTALMVFKPRYEGAGERQALFEEFGWLERVRTLMLSVAAGARPIERARLEANVAWFIDQPLAWWRYDQEQQHPTA